MNSRKNLPGRRYIAYVSSFGTTHLHLRNPWVVAFWSAMFPGLGHILLFKYIRGFLLFIWEVFINNSAHLNLALLYSFTGRFSEAKDIINIEWTLFYIPAYLFAIWDSYRSTVDINNNYILAAREDAEVAPFKMDTMEINYLDKKSPWSSVLWSVLAPGAAQLSNHRIIIAFFILIWWIVIAYYAKLFPAIHYVLLGDLMQVKSIIKAQWFLNIPSIYFFAMYDGFINTVESNKLFDWEQAKFLKRDYHNKYFSMPFKNSDGGECMYMVSTFEHSISLEKAITAIQMKGVAKENILAVPMDKRGEERSLLDSIHYSDGLSLLDLSFILASFLALFGSIYGFVLKWGPIVWGIIGLVVGFGLGLVIKVIYTRKYMYGRMNKKVPEVVLIIKCGEHQTEIIKNMLWMHNALGVRKLDLNINE